MAKASAASRALARIKAKTIENETLRKAGKATAAAIRSDAGQAVAVVAVAGTAGAVAGYKLEQWIHDPERGYAADSMLLTGFGGIPVTSIGGAVLAAVGITRILAKKGKFKTNAAIAGLGSGAAGGGYVYKLANEA